MIFADLNNEIAERAIAGDHNAQMQLLKRYDGYINKAATVTVSDKQGNSRRYVDEDIKIEIQIKYLEELSKCRVVKTV